MHHNNQRILVIGACGQLGSELTLELRKHYGEDNVVASDLASPKDELKDGLFEHLDIMDQRRLGDLIDKYKITQIYHLAAVLSATGEKNPKLAWKLNMDGLIHVLDAAVEKSCPGSTGQVPLLCLGQIHPPIILHSIL